MVGRWLSKWKHLPTQTFKLNSAITDPIKWTAGCSKGACKENVRYSCHT